MNEDLKDVEKLIALSWFFEIYKSGGISKSEFQNICDSEKEILSNNKVSFSSFIEKKNL